jgi:tetratricopeptide (TPR) repeat protein
MKISFKTLLGAALAMTVTALSAQTPEMLEVMCANGETAGTNNSLYNDYFPKGGQAKPLEAYEPWKALYDAVPNFNLALYLNGEKILVAKCDQAQKGGNTADQERYAKELQKLCDDRIANGFATKTVPAEAIKLKKIDYFKKYDLDATDKGVYDRYTEVLKDFRGGAQPYYISQWCTNSLKLAKAGQMDKNQYIEDYMKSTEYLDEALDRYVLRYTDDTTKLVEARVAGKDTTKLFRAANVTKGLMKGARDNKLGLTSMFAQSGYADVNTLVDIFTPQVEEKKTDLAFLNNVSKLLGRSAEGRETDLYTHVADYSYQIKPSMEAAKGLAKAALKAKDYDRALQYYDEALTHAIQPDDKTEILMYEAAIYQQEGQKAKAREVLRRSLSIDPEQDTPHVMIANMYASSANSCGEEKPALKSLVFVAAYNEMQAAIAHASSDEKRAAYQRTCGSYKSAFPAKGDLFMQAGKTPGQTHTLGGWMGVTVTIQCQ